MIYQNGPSTKNDLELECLCVCICTCVLDPLALVMLESLMDQAMSYAPHSQNGSFIKR